MSESSELHGQVNIFEGKDDRLNSIGDIKDSSSGESVTNVKASATVDGNLDSGTKGEVKARDESELGGSTPAKPTVITRREFLSVLPKMVLSAVLPSTESGSEKKAEGLSGPLISSEKFRLSSDTLQVLSESLPEGIRVDKEGNVYGLLDFEEKLDQDLGRLSVSSEFLSPQNIETLVRNSWYASAVDAVRYYGTEYNSFAGSNVSIAVLDTGLFRSDDEIRQWFPGVNVDFLGDFSPGADSRFRNIYDNDTMRIPGGHGTKATTLMAAQRVGLIRPRSLMIAKIYDMDGVSNVFSVADALERAIDRGADVVMLNWGFPSDIISSYFDRPLKIAAEKGVVIMAAAHNYSQSSPYFPAGFADRYAGLYSVSAIGENLQPTSWTNRPGNIKNAFYLPGMGIHSINHNNQQYLMSGTSASTPMAAAFAAIAISEFRRNYSSATRPQIRTEAMKSLVDSGKGLIPIDPLGPYAKVPQLQSFYRHIGARMPTWVKGEVYLPLVQK